MATETWTTSHPLVRRALSSPRGFDFFQLVQMIERLAKDVVPIGHQGPYAQEPLRLRPWLDFSFPVAEVDKTRWHENAQTGRGHLMLDVTFMGLYGSVSPLPTHFTEDLLGGQDEDERVRDFIDIFHHRILSLLYRVWKKYRYHINFQRDGNDPISRMVRGFLGIGTDFLDEAVGFEPINLFRYAGLLSQRPRSAAGLVGQLQDYFGGIPVEFEPCVGRWLRIQPGDQNRSGEKKCTLGQDFLMGANIFDRSGKFRIKIGPVGFDDYQRFLPNGKASKQLRDIVQFYCEDPYDFDVELILRGEDVPDLQLGGGATDTWSLDDLGSDEPAADAEGESKFDFEQTPEDTGVLGRLSWTSWVKSEPCEDKSVIFSIERKIHAED